MAQLAVGGVHHIRLSANDLERSRAFYTDLPPFGIALLPFRDPDGIQLELTAPL